MNLWDAIRVVWVATVLAGMIGVGFVAWVADVVGLLP